jgi:hypothetical protein
MGREIESIAFAAKIAHVPETAATGGLILLTKHAHTHTGHALAGSPTRLTVLHSRSLSSMIPAAGPPAARTSAIAAVRATIVASSLVTQEQQLQPAAAAAATSHQHCVPCQRPSPSPSVIYV